MTSNHELHELKNARTTREMNLSTIGSLDPVSDPIFSVGLECGGKEQSPFVSTGHRN
jgi:hypothetical protein